MKKIWGVLWIQKGSIDGDCESLVYKDCKPVMFSTKRECKKFIDETYKFITARKDLRRYPHGWRLPKPVKLRINYQRVNG